MIEIDSEQIKEYLRENLSLDVTTSSKYTGGTSSGPLYKDVHTLKLILDGETISEVSLH